MERRECNNYYYSVVVVGFVAIICRRRDRIAYEKLYIRVGKRHCRYYTYVIGTSTQTRQQEEKNKKKKKNHIPNLNRDRFPPLLLFHSTIRRGVKISCFNYEKNIFETPPVPPTTGSYITPLAAVAFTSLGRRFLSRTRARRGGVRVCRTEILLDWTGGSRR